MTATPARRRASLRLELIAMLAIVLVMAVVSLSFAAEWLGQRRHDQHEIERLQAHARGMAVLAARSFRGGDFERDALETLLADSAAQLAVSYEIHRFSATGESEPVAKVGMHAGFAELPAPQVDRPRVDESLVERWNLLVIDEPVATHAEQRVVLRLIAEHSPWMRSHDWRETLIVASGVGVVLLLLGGLLLELQVLRPMRALERAVGQVGGGRLDVEAPTEGPRELAELAQTFNDMTASLRRQRDELRSQAERLQRSERLAAIGGLAAGVAHEVGNPLAAIVGYVELLLGGPALAPDDRDLLERMLAQTQRIQAIVGQLLDYSKPARVQAIGFAAGDPIASVVALLRADPRCAKVELSITGAGELELRGDPSLVEQILINLVLNGAQAASEGPGPARVEIAVLELSASEAAIEVRDSGPGVSAQVRERVFEPFFSTRGAGKGTGLGLAISLGLAESMEGRLECREHSGTGAIFRLVLPRCRSDHP
ncbi:sensor histidine kinase [Nannocystaceae bacterium ST9]